MPGERRSSSRWLGRSLVSVFILAVLAALVLAWVLTTATGARWGIGLATGLLPGKLDVEKIEGSFADELKLDNVQYRSADLQAQIAHISVALALRDLLADRLTLSRLSARAVRLHISSLSSPDAPAAVPRLPAAPFSVRVRHAELFDLAISVDDATGAQAQSGAPIEIAALVSALTWDTDGLLLDSATARAGVWGLTATSVGVSVAEQRLAGRLQLDGAVPGWPAVAVTARLEGSLATPGFHFTSQAPWSVQGHGNWDVAARAGRLSGRYRLEPAVLRAGWPVMALAGAIDVTGSPGGLKVQLDWASESEEPLNAGWQGAAAVDFQGSRADFTTGVLVLPFVEGGVLNGRVDLVGAYPLQLQAGWQAASFADNTVGAARLGPGKINVSGPLATPALAFTAESAVAGVGSAAGTVHGSGRLDRSALDVPDFRLVFGAGELRGAVRLGFPDASAGTHLAAQLQAKAFDPSIMLPDWAGALDGEVTFEAAPPADPENLRAAVAADLRGTLRGQPVRLAGRAAIDGQTADLQIGDGRFGDARVHGDLARWPLPDVPWRADLQVSRFDLGTWLPGWTGEADLRLRTTGSGKAGEILAEGDVRGLSAGDLEPGNLSVKLAGSQARHRIGLVWESARLTAQAGWQGRLALPAAKDWSYRFTLDQLSLDLGQVDFGLVAPADGRVAPASVRLARTCVRAADGDHGEVCIEAGGQRPGEAGPALRTVFGIDARALGLDPFRPLLGRLPRIEGTLAADAELNWFRDGHWALRSANLSTSTLRVLPADAEADEAWTTVPAADVQFVPRAGQGLRATLQTRGDATPAAHGQVQLVPGLRGWSDVAIDGRIDFDLGPLAALGALFPAYRLHAGRLSGYIAVGGTRAAPLPSGELLLAGGDIGIPELGLRLRDGQATVRMQAGSTGDLQALEVTLGGTSSGGTFALDGRVLPVFGTAGGWEGLRGALRLTGEAVQVIDIDAARVAVSPDLTLSIDRQSLALTGEVAINRALVVVREQPASAIRVSADQRIVDAGGTVSAGTDLRRRLSGLDVKLRLGDDTRFTGYGLDAGLAGTLRLRQQDGRTTANGTIRTRPGGRYAAWGQTLDIRAGRLFWADTALTQPALDVEASRTPVPDVTVGLTARGPLARPRIELWSTPALSQSEQLSWLLLGRSLQSSANTAGETSLVNQAAATLGIGAGNLLARQFGGQLPVDIGIEVPAGATQASAALVVGRQLTPDLYVSYGVSILERLSTLRIEYALSTLLRVVTESSGDHNAADVYIAVERP